jgi:hypothetical protein
LYQLTHAAATIDTRVYDNGGRMTSSNTSSSKTYFNRCASFDRSDHFPRTVENNGFSETRAYGTDNTLASISFAGASLGI